MRKQRSSLPGPDKGSSRIVVHHRRLSRLPITIPVPQKALDLEATPRDIQTNMPRPEDPEVELKKLQERFAGTTPQEREILRKLGFRIEQLLEEKLRSTAQGQT
jgi:hypothetical protein